MKKVTFSVLLVGLLGLFSGAVMAGAGNPVLQGAGEEVSHAVAHVHGDESGRSFDHEHKEMHHQGHATIHDCEKHGHCDHENKSEREHKDDGDAH